MYMWFYSSNRRLLTRLLTNIPCTFLYFWSRVELNTPSARRLACLLTPNRARSTGRFPYQFLPGENNNKWIQLPFTPRMDLKTQDEIARREFNRPPGRLAQSSACSCTVVVLVERKVFGSKFMTPTSVLRLERDVLSIIIWLKLEQQMNTPPARSCIIMYCSNSCYNHASCMHAAHIFGGAVNGMNWTTNEWTITIIQLSLSYLVRIHIFYACMICMIWDMSVSCWGTNGIFIQHDLWYVYRYRAGQYSATSRSSNVVRVLYTGPV